MINIKPFILYLNAPWIRSYQKPFKYLWRIGLKWKAIPFGEIGAGADTALYSFYMIKLNNLYILSKNKLKKTCIFIGADINSNTSCKDSALHLASFFCGTQKVSNCLGVITSLFEAGKFQMKKAIHWSQGINCIIFLHPILGARVILDSRLSEEKSWLVSIQNQKKGKMPGNNQYQIMTVLGFLVLTLTSQNSLKKNLKFLDRHFLNAFVNKLWFYYVTFY